MSRVELMKEAIQVGEAEKKIGKELPNLMISHLSHAKPYAEQMKEIETVFRPMFQRNIFLERYIKHIRKLN
jgi:hypothetical protein